MGNSGLTIWTVYCNPRDYPGKWVLRAADVGTGVRTRGECVVADSLEKVRAALPPGLTRLERHPCDDLVIYESWV